MKKLIGAKRPDFKSRQRISRLFGILATLGEIGVQKAKPAGDQTGCGPRLEVNFAHADLDRLILLNFVVHCWFPRTFSLRMEPAPERYNLGIPLCAERYNLDIPLSAIVKVKDKM